MGATLSKSDGCVMFLCGSEDDAYDDTEFSPQVVERLNDDQRIAAVHTIGSLQEEIERNEFEVRVVCDTCLLFHSLLVGELAIV